MSEQINGFVVVALTRDEARVWLTGVESGARPERIVAPHEQERHHHVREAQHHSGRATDHDDAEFYEAIATQVAPAKEIILVGHGKGKADAVLGLTQFLERKHPTTARKVIGAVDSDIEALTSNQILALVREWFARYRDFI